MNSLVLSGTPGKGGPSESDESEEGEHHRCAKIGDQSQAGIW